jgi:hypothetical protein
MIGPAFGVKSGGGERQNGESNDGAYGRGQKYGLDTGSDGSGVISGAARRGPSRRREVKWENIDDTVCQLSTMHAQVSQLRRLSETPAGVINCGVNSQGIRRRGFG